MSRTVYEYDDGVLVAAVTDSEWSDLDRGLVLALLEERRETCPSCGHPMSVCRDAKTAGSWQVVQDVCQPSRVAQAVAEGLAESKARGVMLLTRRT